MKKTPLDPQREALLAKLLELEQNPQPTAWPLVAATWGALTPDPEDWDLQLAMAGVARALALLDLHATRTAVALIQQSDLAAKTEHRCYTKIQNYAEQLLTTNPEAALALVEPLPARYLAPVKVVAAVRIFATDRARGLALYHELKGNPYLATACLKLLGEQDWRVALELAEQLPAHQSKSNVLLKLAEVIALHDFRRAEIICDELLSGQFNRDAHRVLPPFISVKTAEELFALLNNPKYYPYRFQTFLLHENLLRAWCKVPLLSQMGETPQHEFERDETYWDTHRRITYLVEADPVVAFGLLRSLTNADWRRRIFEYARAEYLQLR